MNKSLVSVAFLIGTMPIFATTYTWTGQAGNNKWVDAANWSPNGIPGSYTDESGTVVGDITDTAVFGADASGAAEVTIDLAKQIRVTSVTISDDAPAYTFGTDATAGQGLGFSGTLKVSAGVQNDFRVRRINLTGGKAHYLENDSAKTFFFGDVGRIDGTSGNGYFYMTGGGPFDFEGSGQFDQVGWADFAAAGKYRWNDKSGEGSRIAHATISAANVDIEIPEGGNLSGKGGSYNESTMISFSNSGRIWGRGKVQVTYPWNNPDEDKYAPDRISVNADKVGTIECCVAPRNTSTKDLVVTGDGTLLLKGTNTMAGALRLVGGVTVGARLFGNKGCTAEETSVPRGDRVVYEGASSYKIVDKHITSTTGTARPAGTFKYIGAADGSSDRELYVTNNYVAVKPELWSTNTFANAGEGPFTLNSAITQAGDIKAAGSRVAFRLCAETAPLTFAGAFDDGNWTVLVAGPETVTVSTEQTYDGETVLESGTLAIPAVATLPNTAGFVFRGGALRLLGGEGEAITLAKPCTLLSGGLEVPAGKRLTLADADLSAVENFGFTIPSGSSLFITGATPGNLPASVTVNGYRAKVTAEGEIVERRSNWATAADGNWAVAANWTPGAPAPGDSVIIDATGADYTVTADETALDGFDDLRIGTGSDAATATLAIVRDQTFDTERIQVGKGGAIGVVGADKQVTFANGSTLTLADGGKLAAVSGTNNFPAASVLDMRGGVIDLSGTAVFEARGEGVTFGTGETTFRENALWRVKGSTTYTVRPNAAGEKATLTFDGTAKVQSNGDHATLVVGRMKGGETVCTFNQREELQKDSTGAFSGMRIAYEAGLGIVNFSNGITRTSNAGFSAGDGPSQNTQLGQYPTGIVNVVGGTYVSVCYQTAYMPAVVGFIIGNGVNSNKRGDSLFRGICNVESGALTVNGGLPIVGCGPCGEGDLNVSGGSFSSASRFDHNSDHYQCPTIVGFAGGVGRFTQTGGKSTFTTAPLFIGGALTTDLDLTGKAHHNDLVYTKTGKRDAEGAVRLSGGEFSTSYPIYVGADGKGELAIGGTVQMTGKTLVLSNACESVLKFTLDTATPGWSASVTNLVVTDGAKLVVDASALASKPSGVTRLLTADAVTGAFAADKVELLCKPEMAKYFDEATILYERNGAKGIWLRRAPIGLVLLLK